MSKNIRKVISSPTARITRLEAINLILTKWPIEVAIQFDNDVEALIEHIKSNNKLCPKSKIQMVRKCVVSRQTSMVYQIYDDHIEIVTFVDNRSDHDY